jgi:hypothetical protein
MTNRDALFLLKGFYNTADLSGLLGRGDKCIRVRVQLTKAAATLCDKIGYAPPVSFRQIKRPRLGASKI